MAVTSITCPSCSKLLKSTNPVPPGTVVKCPGCKVNFTVPPLGYSAAAEGKKKPVTAVAGGKPAQGTPPPRNKQRPARPRDDDDYDDRRPAKKKNAAGGNTMLIVGLAGGGVVVLALLAVAAFVWPGFMLSAPTTPEAGKSDSGTPTASGSNKDKKKKQPKTNKEGGNEDGGTKEAGKTDKDPGKTDKNPGKTDKELPKIDTTKLPPTTDFTRFLPADSDLVVGVNFGGANNAILKKYLKMASAFQVDDGTGSKELVLDMDFVALAGNSTVIKDRGPSVVICQTANGHDPEAIRSEMKATKATLAGMTVYRKGQDLFYFPDPRSFIGILKLPDEEAGRLITAQKSTLSRKDLLEQIDKVKGKTVWAVFSVEKSEMIKELAGAPQLKAVPNGQLLPPVLQAAKLATLTANLEDGSLKIELSLVCKNSADAATAEKVLKPLVDQSLPLFIKGMVKEMKQVPDKLASSLVDDISKFEIRASGADLTARLTFRNDTVSQVVALVDGMINSGTSGNDPKLSVTENARRIQSTNNLKQLTLAMHSYHAIYLTLPPPATFDRVKMDGKPLLSWRVAMLPYIEEGKLYNEFKQDEPWDSPHNIKLLSRMPKVFAPVGVKTKEPNTTFYQVFVGSNPALPTPPFVHDRDRKIFIGFGLNQIIDGTSNTIAIVEAAEAVPWTKPQDLEYDAKKPLPKIGGTVFADGFHCSLTDGSVRFVRPAPAGVSVMEAAKRGEVSAETLRDAITCNDGKVLGNDW